MAKILHICSNYCTTKIFPNMLYKLNQKFGENYLYCPVKYNASENNYSYLDKNDEIFLYNKDYAKISPSFSKLDTMLFFPKRTRISKDIQSMYNINSFDVLMGHSLFTDGWVARKLAKKYNKEYVVFIQNSDINYFFKKMFFLRSRAIKIMRDAKAIIMCSEVVKSELFVHYVPAKYKEELESKIVTIPFGIEERFTSDIYTKERELKEEINIITVGTIDDNKNQIAVAKAISKMLEQGYSIRYTLAGNVVSEERLQELCQYEFVEYVGRKNYEELISLYRRSDIFVLTSIFETFGLVYAEAMSQGLPIVYSKGQGFDGIFEDGMVGYRANALDSDDIQKAIKKVIENYSELSRNARKQVAIFDWNNVATKYYQTIVR